MWPFLLGLLGWTALLLWGWIQVGGSLGGRVRGKTTAEKQPAAGTTQEAATERNSDDVITTILRD